MKLNELNQARIQAEKLPWPKNPSLGWIGDNKYVPAFYGVSASKLKPIFKNGIMTSPDGYTLVSCDPYTARTHSWMREGILSESEIFQNDTVVLHLKLPRNRVDIQNSKWDDPCGRLNDRKIYESWQGSDSEYYACINWYVPHDISPEFIRGYSYYE